MSREMSVKVWDKQKRVMSGPYPFEEFATNGIEVDREKLSYLEWLWFTGLKDKNGKEIYEGDLIRIEGHGDEVHHVVFWHNMFCAESLWGKEQDERAHFNWANFSRGGGLDFIPEVIGNIYENPELLNSPGPLEEAA